MTTEDVGWERGRCIKEGQLINTGSPLEDRTKRVKTGIKPDWGLGGADEAEWTSLKLLEAFLSGRWSHLVSVL